MSRWCIVLSSMALVACGSDGARPGAGTELDTAAETGAEVTSIDVATEVADAIVDAAPETMADTSVPETVTDTSAPETATPDTQADDVLDTTLADTAEVAVDPASCPVPTMDEIYPGPFPPFPYGPWPRAEGCVAVPHDVVIVLGCPSESDGSPSTCQIERARIADQLYEADWAQHFIVTGAAVHNEYVEADALFDLLVSRGIPADAIIKEPLAQHTDENIYYSTRIMQAQGWTSALVVSEDPGHLVMTALCDANCCVDLGRLTLLEWEVLPDYTVKAGHYALIPPGQANTDAECAHIASMVMCINQGDRKACKDNFQL